MISNTKISLGSTISTGNVSQSIAANSGTMSLKTPWGVACCCLLFLLLLLEPRRGVCKLKTQDDNSFTSCVLVDFAHKIQYNTICIGVLVDSYFHNSWLR